MTTSFAHIREQGLDCAIFDANASNDSDSGRAELLSQLKALARSNGLHVDRAVLAYSKFGRLSFYGDRDLVQFLIRHVENGGGFSWTHKLTV